MHRHAADALAHRDRHLDDTKAGVVQHQQGIRVRVVYRIIVESKKAQGIGVESLEAGPPKGTETVREVPQVLAASARTCQRDLYLVWSTARETPFQAVATGQLRMSDLKRLSGQLLVQESIVKGSKESDYRRLFFLRRLAEKLALLRWKSEQGLYQLTAKADPAFLHVDPAQRVQDSFLAWRDGDWWNELWATYVLSLIHISEPTRPY